VMLERGFLATDTFYATYAHQDCHAEAYLTVVDEVFDVIARAVERSGVSELLKGPVAHAGFYRLT
ncbi:MAG: aminotransferase class III, partial [Deltaproteobacteria bacterium]|nr:aminotransferase class III [Deltaproteobacteria bacterium]